MVESRSVVLFQALLYRFSIVQFTHILCGHPVYGSKFYLCFFCKPGDRCELNIDNCASLPCLNSGECIDLIDDYQCNCQTGYIGKNCQHEVDVCNQLGPDGEKLEICQNGGQCLAQQGYRTKQRKFFFCKM